MSAQKRNISDQILDRLAEWKVRRIFGFPGDGVNGVMGALNRAGDRFEFVQVAHEELAGLMATAHAKVTDEVGVCICTSGPGAIHMLNGLYDAKLDHQPVVAIVGQQAFAGVGGSSQQETNLRSLLQDVASGYLETISDPEQVEHVIDRAFRAALGGRTVAAIIVPHDVQQKEPVAEPRHEHGRQHSSAGYTPSRIVASDDALRRAAEVLNAGRKVAMLVGAGSLGAGPQVARVAERLGAGVAKALLGKCVLPDDLPYVTGSVGWLGTSASNRMMKECDTLLMVGTNFPYTEFLPEPGQARGVQIDVEPRNLALRYPMEVAIEGDASETLAALLPLLDAREDTSWREQVERWVREWNDEAENHADAPANPVNPQRIVRSLGSALPDDAIVMADSGSSAVWMARHIPVRRATMCTVSGGLATMGCSVPYALAAKLAHPGRCVVALAGDGAMQMIGLNALIDVAKEWGKSRARKRAWGDARLVVVVLNNRDLNYVTWEQRAMEGDPRYDASQSLPDIRYADYAKLIGLDGVRVEKPEEIEGAIARALSAKTPFVIDAVVDASVPTLPPKLTTKIEEKLAEALSDGDSDAAAVMEQLHLQELT